MENSIRNIIIISGACIAAVIGVASIPDNIFKEKSHSSQRINVQNGINKLEDMEKRDIYEIESEIQSANLKREAANDIAPEEITTEAFSMDMGQTIEPETIISQNPNDNTQEQDVANHAKYTENVDVHSINYKEVFANSVVMGDSISAAIYEYDILDSNSVVAKVGASLLALDDALDTVTQLSPQNVFLYYGLNDVGHVGDNYDKFRSEYESFVIRLKEALPNANIYANLLFPVNDASKIGLYYEDLTPYNDIIIDICKQQGIICLDNRDIVRDEYYEGDGYHFKINFYPQWLYRMALGAGLI